MLLLLACVAPDAKPGLDDTGPADTGTPDPDPVDPWFCDEGGYTLAGGVIETEHYRLTFEIDESEALLAAQLAEASYDAMADYFGAEPPDLPLEAGWYADFASFQAAIEADGTTAPTAGGYYWPGTRRAYMYTQPTVYFSRMLFVHELVHQFHFLARTGNQSRESWYAEGLAEYLSRHDWDDGCARLGRRPMLTWEDYPAQALAEGSYTFDGHNDLSRPWALATVRYLQTETPAAFDAFRDAYDADATVALADHVDVGETVAAVEAWLPGDQEPMTPIFYDWIHVTEGVVDGEAPYFSTAVAKSGSLFGASHDAPVGSAGIMAGFDDSANYSAWLVGADGKVWTFVSTDNNALWWEMGAVPVAERYEWALDGTTVTVNGVSFEETNGFTPRGGLALYGDEVRFEVALP
jgi:hypothetical protein